MEAPIKRAVKNNGHPAEAERPTERTDVGGKAREGRKEGDAGARRTRTDDENAREVERELERRVAPLRPVRLFSTPFATPVR